MTCRGDGKTKAMNVGVVFCGRQSSGGHNVVAGLFDYLHAMNPTSKLLGFIGGTSGLFEGSCIEVTEETLRLYRNTGGYDLLGRSADKISEEDYSKVVASCTKFNLDGLVLIGGAYTATDATLLTEFLLNSGVKTRIVVVPCDYSRDLKNNFVETTVGFDTYCRTVSALIGNISTDSRSAAKYYHFIRLLGRSPSHVVLEAALQSHPNYAIISEEVAAKRLTLLQVVNKLADVICERARNGQNYGVVLIPEGLIKSISEFSFLLDEISTYVNKGIARDEIYAKLTPWSKALFDFLPPVIQQQIFARQLPAARHLDGGDDRQPGATGAAATQGGGALRRQVRLPDALPGLPGAHLLPLALRLRLRIRAGSRGGSAGAERADGISGDAPQPEGRAEELGAVRGAAAGVHDDGGEAGRVPSVDPRVERGHDGCAVPEVRGASRRVGGEGRLLQPRRRPVRRSGQLEHDAVAADREARLPEADSEAACSAEDDRDDLSAWLRRRVDRLGDRRHGGRDWTVGYSDKEEDLMLRRLFVVRMVNTE